MQQKNSIKWILFLLGMIILLFSTKFGILLTTLNIDGTTENMALSYLNNYSSSFRCIGLSLIVFPLFYYK